jgi:hypothetical protein
MNRKRPSRQFLQRRFQGADGPFGFQRVPGMKAPIGADIGDVSAMSFTLLWNTGRLCRESVVLGAPGSRPGSSDFFRNTSKNRSRPSFTPARAGSGPRMWNSFLPPSLG